MENKLTTSDEKTIEILTEEMRAAVSSELDALEGAAFNAGVEEGLKQARNPGYKPQFKKVAKSGTTQTKPPASVMPSPIDLAARAHALQDEAAGRGEQLTNIEACRQACSEAGVPF